ncbi:siderophore ABC transporter substrate-binding protein [Modestobacter sp. VKM Ac-2977]|uniref:siderophore ABC transporter substrate-binding protein n=1 Tax=Modestobacter sp. VKM Ac-2977 TaxID=3004131 RepID=UPI0022AA8A37|nr:siderophore ABC transporter substrate-binding protein [Modestobacter sp. VKM Ac-2977]MCZ2821493.1 siderophore ABC transporter substrate-binding protein [Modestobacter sp. VKM Ac-2977]
MSRTSRPLAATALSLTAVLALGACGGGEEEAAASTESSDAPAEVTVAHAQGEATVPVDPETVVVFDLGVLSTLDSLGVEVDGVPDASFPEALAEYGGDEYAKVGSLFEPDYEAVNALEPDLIIVGGRSAAVYPQLAEIAPTLDLSVDNNDFMASFRERTIALAEVFGAEDDVTERLDAIDERASEVSEAAAGAGEGLIVLTTGGEVSAYGPGSRFGGLIHDTLGVTPADDGLSDSTHGDAVSFEYIAETDPDLLYVIDRDATIGESGAAAQAVLDNELVRSTTAWSDDAVTYLDGADWYLAPNGLPNVERMVEEIAESVGA